MNRYINEPTFISQQQSSIPHCCCCILSLALVGVPCTVLLLLHYVPSCCTLNPNPAALLYLVVAVPCCCSCIMYPLFSAPVSPYCKPCCNLPPAVQSGIRTHGFLTEQRHNIHRAHRTTTIFSELSQILRVAQCSKMQELAW